MTTRPLTKELTSIRKYKIALQQLAIPVPETRAKANSKADNVDDGCLILSSLHPQDSTSHDEQNQKIDISRPKHTAWTDVTVAPKFTEGELRATRT